MTTSNHILIHNNFPNLRIVIIYIKNALLKNCIVIRSSDIIEDYILRGPKTVGIIYTYIFFEQLLLNDENLMTNFKIIFDYV